MLVIRCGIYFYHVQNVYRCLGVMLVCIDSVSSVQMKSLTMFQHDPGCMVLLMDGSAALGLDLSFVTYVFLMEPIWDRRYYKKILCSSRLMDDLDLPTGLYNKKQFGLHDLKHSCSRSDFWLIVNPDHPSYLSPEGSYHFKYMTHI